MFVGHEFLAFTLTALIGLYLSGDRQQALELGLIAGAFAALPDLDILHAWKEILVLLTGTVFQFADAFWQASQAVHRGPSHSLITALVASLGFTAYYKTQDSIIAGIFLLSLTAGTYIIAGLVAAFIMAAYAIAGIIITRIAYQKTAIGEKAFLGTAILGLGSHPFGDLFTGVPPDMLWPAGITLIPERIILLPEPTLNLITLFFIELILAWAGLYLAARLIQHPLPEHIHPAAILGLVYTATAMFLQPPTLSLSYHFVFSLIGLGVFVAFLHPWLPPERRPLPRLRHRPNVTLDRSIIHIDPVLALIATGTATVTLGIIGYTIAYIITLLW